MSFTWPLALVGLLLVPLFAVAYVWSERRRRALQARFGNPDLLPNVIDRSPGRLRQLPIVLALFALAAMIVGVARPHATVSVPREDATVILALDVSRSMKARDVAPTRLDAARAAAKEFVAHVPEKFRIGVVSFATRAAVGVAPTVNRSLVDAALDSLAPGEGTAIGDAVALSLEVGQPRKRNGGPPPPPRSILLISDGARDGGRIDPAEAARLAKKRGVPVYSVLVGTDNGVVRERLVGGYQRVIRVPPSPETLAQISSVTGGRFFTAPNAGELRRVYEELGTRLGHRNESREVTDAFAAGSVALLLVAGTMSALLFRRVP